VFPIWVHDRATAQASTLRAGEPLLCTSHDIYTLQRHAVQHEPCRFISGDQHLLHAQGISNILPALSLLLQTFYELYALGVFFSGAGNRARIPGPCNTAVI